jgi:hypothetical protein
VSGEPRPTEDPKTVWIVRDERQRVYSIHATKKSAENEIDRVETFVPRSKGTWRIEEWIVRA